MIHCQECHHALPDGTLFCDQCGNVVDTEPTVRERPTAAPGPQSTPTHLPDAAPTPATPIATYPRFPASVHPVNSPASSPHTGPLPRVRLRLTNGKTFELSGKLAYVIGRRDSQTGWVPDVDLDEWHGAAYGVSRRHATIHVTAEGVSVEDRESLNETVRNGYRLLPHQRYPLADSDELRLGSITLLVVIS